MTNLLVELNKVNAYSLETVKEVSEYLAVQKKVTDKEKPEEMLEQCYRSLEEVQSLPDASYDSIDGERVEEELQKTIIRLKQCISFIQDFEEDIEFDEKIQQKMENNRKGIKATEQKDKMRYFIGNEANNHGILYKGNVVTTEGAYIVYEHGETVWQEEFLPFQLKEISKSKYYELAKKK
ncbi:hypothetical protein [Priestia megaterium]|uniref:hypothetical protein n=1 Tax=Priestia megaterium TaxID=1404 RepID=UPI0023DAED3D|nr:hypothetical protein [Priestia megaterium]MDF2010218.1 hypothetical protein [Priestia megaterium]